MSKTAWNSKMLQRTDGPNDTARCGVACPRLKFSPKKRKNEKENIRAFLAAFVTDSLFSRVHATLQPALSVGRSVGLSVGPSHFTFFYDFISLTSLLLPKWSGDLKYGPCPPARDFGSHVSGLVERMRYSTDQTTDQPTN